MALPLCKVAENLRGNHGKIKYSKKKKKSISSGLVPWSRKWQPTPVSLPGKSQGQRSLVGSILLVNTTIKILK